MLAVNRLLYLAAEKSTTPVPMEINSPGGPMAHCSEILGVMHGVRYPIATFCRGEVRGVVLVEMGRGQARVGAGASVRKAGQGGP
jgi:ATP-dependent protease ClpP protease subunit